MKLNTKDVALAVELGEGEFINTNSGNVFSLCGSGMEWYVTVLGRGWEYQTTCHILPNLADGAVKLPKSSSERAAMLELWKAHQEGVTKLGRCTPSARCPSHAAQQQIDLEIEECPVTMLAGSLIAAREVADEESVIGFFTDDETNDMYKVVIQYIGNRSND